MGGGEAYGGARILRGSLFIKRLCPAHFERGVGLYLEEFMTIEEKSEILARISMLLDEYISKPNSPDRVSEPCEMLTIKECSQAVKGLSEHTVRLLVARGELASIRTGAGKHGKILVPKSSLLKYVYKIQG